MASRIVRDTEGYSGLWTFFFAFRCPPQEADQMLRRDSPLDNSVAIEPGRITVTDDATDGKSRPIIVPAQFPRPPVFPDVFYEKHDLSGCSILRIRTYGAPEWYTPQKIQRGLADRNVWRKGQIHSEYYYDRDTTTMYLRFDELRPD